MVYFINQWWILIGKFEASTTDIFSNFIRFLEILVKYMVATNRG